MLVQAVAFLTCSYLFEPRTEYLTFLLRLLLSVSTLSSKFLNIASNSATTENINPLLIHYPHITLTFDFTDF